MGGFSNYWRNKLLSHGMGKEVYSAPANYYVGLSATDPGADGLGLSEPVGGSYTRVVTDSGDWSDVSSFQIQNTSTIQFDKATSAWGTMAYFAVFDASEDGNILWYGALNASVAVGLNDVVFFNPSDLAVSH